MEFQANLQNICRKFSTTLNAGTIMIIIVMLYIYIEQFYSEFFAA